MNDDLISRQAVLEQARNYGSNTYLIPVNSVKTLPSVTPTRPTGRWIDIQYFKNDDTYYRPKCPFCSIEPKEYSNYCPNCGAKMQEVEE